MSLKSNYEYIRDWCNHRFLRRDEKVDVDLSNYYTKDEVYAKDETGILWITYPPGTIESTSKSDLCTTLNITSEQFDRLLAGKYPIIVTTFHGQNGDTITGRSWVIQEAMPNVGVSYIEADSNDPTNTFTVYISVEGNDSYSLNWGRSRYESTASKVTSISSSNNDVQYPSAKAVYDFVTNNTSSIASVVSALTPTAAEIADKVANIVVSTESFQLTPGVNVFVRFTNTNTAANPTLNVENWGAKTIKLLRNNELIDLPDPGMLAAGRSYRFQYNGTYWVLMDDNFLSVDQYQEDEEVIAASLNDLNTRLATAGVWETGTGTNSVILKGSEGTAAGNYSVVEGYKSETGGSYTENPITFDTNDTTSGSYAHVEGRGNIASGALGAHAEGNKNLASGNCAHAEGGLNVASGNMSHAEGNRTLASGGRSHAEGTSTTASGASSHAEGTHTIASALDSHAEGQYTVAEGVESYVGGYYSKALGDLSNVYGFNSFGINYGTHAEGTTIAYGDRSHAENGCKGMEVLPIGTANATSYTSTFDEEWRSVRTAVGDTVFCNIIKASTIKQKQNSTDIMPIRIISASYSGDTLTFTVESTLSETALDGSVEYWINMSVAYGEFSHSENEGNISYGEGSHSEGEYTVAIGNFSHTEGIGTITNNVGEHAEGQYNKSTKTNTTYGNAGNTQHSIGIGTSSARKNAVEVMQNGDMYVIGLGGYDGTNPTATTSSSIQSIVSGIVTQLSDIETVLDQIIQPTS